MAAGFLFMIFGNGKSGFAMRLSTLMVAAN
jgi:hypothetical protein